MKKKTLVPLSTDEQENRLMRILNKNQCQGQSKKINFPRKIFKEKLDKINFFIKRISPFNIENISNQINSKNQIKINKTKSPLVKFPKKTKRILIFPKNSIFPTTCYLS